MKKQRNKFRLGYEPLNTSYQLNVEDRKIEWYTKRGSREIKHVRRILETNVTIFYSAAYLRRN